MTIPLTLQRHHRVTAILDADVHAWLTDRARATGRPVMRIAEDIIVAERARQRIPATPKPKTGEIA